MARSGFSDVSMCERSSYCICTYFCTAKVALLTHLSRVSIDTHGRTRCIRIPIPGGRHSGIPGVGAFRPRHGGCAASVPTWLFVWGVIPAADVVSPAERMAELRALDSFPYGECVSGLCCVVRCSGAIA